jgi:hypothetical protein
MSADLTLDSAREQRNALATRDEVLDKVKALSLLPGTTYVTTEMVANYYEVAPAAVASLVKDHRDEVTSDGYRVLTGDALRALKDLSGLDTRAASLAVFPRRAILRVGMLLRDSEIARSVRDYLLTAEQGSALTPNPAEISRSDLARMILAAEEEKEILAAALRSAEPAIAYHDRFVANDDVVTIKDWAGEFGMTGPQAFALLLDKKIVYRKCVGEHWSRKAQRVVKDYEYRAYAGRQSFAWFDLRPQHTVDRYHNGQVRQTLYVRQPYALDLAKSLGLAERLPAVTS